MLKLIQNIAANARAKEYQNARMIGYSVVNAVESSWKSYEDVLELCRKTILENGK